MSVDEVIQSRRSSKKFSHKSADWRKVIQCIDAARFAPMAGNLFPLKVILVSDKQLISSVAEHTYQDFVGGASHLAVVVSDESKVTRSYGKRGVKYSFQQTGAAIQNILLAATQRKLATCWIGYFDDKRVAEVLKIPENLLIEAIIAFGIDVEARKEHRIKMELGNYLFFDTWGTKEMTKKPKVQWKNS